MTRDEAVTVIANRLGNRTGMSTQIVAELQLAQTRLERSPELPWFLLVESSGFTTGTTAGSTTLPTGFLREHEYESMLVQNASGEWVEVTKLEGFQARGITFTSPGFPQYYSLFETYLRFWPDPDLDYSLYWPHYKADAVLSAGSTENRWLKYHPDVLIGSAGVAMARFLRDPQAISIFEIDLRIALATMNQESVARREAGRRAYMGG